MLILEKETTTVQVAGIQKLTTIDYPGYLSAVLFIRGCPWQCRYCHNPALREYDDRDTVPRSELESFLVRRRGFLEGIVVSGGEPTSFDALPHLLKWIRGFGYRTALHTNGSFPDTLRQIVHDRLVDYIAMDIKAPPRIYDRITQSPDSCIPVARSIDIIASSGIEHEFRTTYHPSILSEDELLEVMRAAARKSNERFYIQMFRKEGVNDEELVRDGDVVTVPSSAVMLGKKLFSEFGVR
ncbi:anaerobic ribonucleoside-triphosphate reductase activating protein [Candidatus Latescibacterota bacterium]